jgi:glycine hydroxymethyltransferase
MPDPQTWYEQLSENERNVGIKGIYGGATSRRNGFMPASAHRSWVSEACETFVQAIAEDTARATSTAIDANIERLIVANTKIHDVDCINLNPATNVLNPRAEAILARGLGSRPSLGYPGNKYEIGLEAIERIEVIAAELAAEIFKARYAEIRVASGAMANLYAFMAMAKPGDAIIVPPTTIGGHVTHHQAGCAGLYGLNIHAAPLARTAIAWTYRR